MIILRSNDYRKCVSLQVRKSVSRLKDLSTYALTDLRGFTVLGVVIAVGILAAMGAGMAVLVATNQSTRTQQLYIDQSFYSTHAGLEFALGQIVNNGEQSVSITRQLLSDTITVTRTGSNINVTGVKGTGSASYRITDPSPPSQSNCLTVNTASAAVSTTDLTGIVLSRSGSCSQAITIATMTVSWQPNNSENLRTIRIDGSDVYSDVTGQGSGTTFNITDVTINDALSHPMNFLRWSADVTNHNFTLTFNMSDGSQRTSTVNFLANNQAGCLTVNTASAQLTAVSGILTDLTGITVQNTCAQAIRFDRMTVSWTPTTPARNLTQVVINGSTLYSASAGSGTQIDVDHLLPATTTHTVDRFRFDNEMLGRNYTIVWQMADGTTVTTTLNLFASSQNGCLTVNTASAARGGTGNVDLVGITLQNSCSADIGITALTVSWSADATRRTTEISIDSVIRFTSGSGNASGVQADFGTNDVYRQDGLGTFALNYIRFNIAILGGQSFTLDFAMADGTTNTTTVTLAAEANSLVVNTSAAALASGGRNLTGITINNSGSSTITWDQVIVSWTPLTPSRTFQDLIVSGTTLFTGGSAASGTTVNHTDITLTAGETRTITRFRFSASMSGRTFTITWVMLDGSTQTVTPIGPF